MANTNSFHMDKACNRLHNIRDKSIVDKEKHIIKNGDYEIWQDIPPREAYEKIFGEALKKYNAKQKRDDRKIPDYYDHIKKQERTTMRGKHAQFNLNTSKRAVYETIIGVYKGDTGTAVDKSLGKTILKEFVSGWNERNPNLRLIGAYYHADEQGEPHVHIDFVPVAKDYKKGLSMQNSLSKAMEQQMHVAQTSRKDNSLTAWRKREADTLDAICKKYGITIEHPQAGMHTTHLNTPEYKEKQAKIQEVTIELNKKQDELQETERLIKIGKNAAENNEKLKYEYMLNPEYENQNAIQRRLNNSQQFIPEHIQEMVIVANSYVSHAQEKEKQLEENFKSREKALNELYKKEYSRQKELEITLHEKEKALQEKENTLSQKEKSLLLKAEALETKQSNFDALVVQTATEWNKDTQAKLNAQGIALHKEKEDIDNTVQKKFAEKVSQELEHAIEKRLSQLLEPIAQLSKKLYNLCCFAISVDAVSSFIQGAKQGMLKKNYITKDMIDRAEKDGVDLSKSRDS